MIRRLSLVGFAAAALVVAACGGSSPTAPPSPPPPPVQPPANAAPSIDGITAQGRRPKQPARYADLRETIDLSAAVRDPETPLDEMTYEWTAPAGTFGGSGRTMTWTAPDATTGPVTITLKITEQYGHPGQPKTFKHEVTSTVVVRVHDEDGEIGDMAWRFLDEFSKPQTNQDWQNVMRDFNAAACPDPREVEAEREDVIRHYTNYEMHAYNIGNPAVTIDFGGACPFRNRPGDACVAVPVFWDSTNKGNKVREPTSGIDHLTAAYSTADSRWWLCGSDYETRGTLGHSFYSR